MTLPPGQRALVVLLYVDATVVNGGFAALIYNPTGESWLEALRSAELVRAEPHAALLRRAGELFPGGAMPKDLDARNAILESWSDDSPEL